MDDKSVQPVATIPTAQDKMSADFEQVARLYRAMREHATEIAQTRRALYLAYVEAGFTPGEALELVSKGLTP